MRRVEKEKALGLVRKKKKSDVNRVEVFITLVDFNLSGAFAYIYTL